MSTTFGKRRGKEPGAATPPPPLPPTPSNKESSPLSRHVRGFMLGVGIVLGLVGLNMFGMKAFGVWLEGKWENVGYPGLDDAVASVAAEAGSGAEVDALQQAHAICARRSEGASFDRSQVVGLSTVEGIAGETELIRSAVYMDCMMEENPARFCAEASRNHLVEALRNYLDLMGKVRQEWKYASNMPSDRSAIEVAYFGTGDDGIREGFPSAAVDSRILAGLRELAMQGYFGEADFGWSLFSQSVPDALLPAFEGVSTNAEPCSA